MAAVYRNIVEIVTSGGHDDDSVVGPGCDDQFEFAPDLMLDIFERLHAQGWSPTDGTPSLEF